MQLTGNLGRLGAEELGDPVPSNGWALAFEAAESVTTQGDCLHLGESLLLGVESNVPILFFALYLGYLSSAVYLGDLVIYTHSRVFGCFESDGQSQLSGKIREGRW